MFLALTDKDLAQFLYNLFDTDRSGSLDVAEVKSIISTVHQKLLNGGRNPVNRLLDDLSKKDHRMTCDEFVAWTKTNPSLLEPIFHLHLNLRNQLIGDNFWQSLQVRRYASGNQMNPQYMDLIQKRLDKISRDLEKKASTSTASRSSKKGKGKKVHPSSGKPKTEEEKKAAASDKKQRTAEKNTLLAEADHPAGRKKSSAGMTTGEKNSLLAEIDPLAAGGGKSKSNAAAEEQKPRKKSSAGLSVDTSGLVGHSAPGSESGDPQKHKSHHHKHHHKHHHQEDDQPTSASSHHHHGHHHGQGHKSGASTVPPSPAARAHPHAHRSESRTSSL
jgi:hypothetical protein